MRSLVVPAEARLSNAVMRENVLNFSPWVRRPVEAGWAMISPRLPAARRGTAACTSVPLMANTASPVSSETFLRAECRNLFFQRCTNGWR